VNTIKRSSKTSTRGSAALEFAVSSMLLMSLVIFTFRFGYSFYAYNKLEAAVAAGARYASRRTYDSATNTPSAAFQTAVANTVVYGDPAGGTQPVVPGLSMDNVQLTVTLDRSVPRQARVSIVDYNLWALTDWRLSGKPFAEFRYMGRFAP
jgi:Flp pilus assembly protein TadG